MLRLCNTNSYGWLFLHHSFVIQASDFPLLCLSFHLPEPDYPGICLLPPLVLPVPECAFPLVCIILSIYLISHPELLLPYLPRVNS